MIWRHRPGGKRTSYLPVAVVRLRPNTHITYRGRTFPLKELDTAEGLPTFYTNVKYRATKPVTINLVVSRKGKKVWYLATTFDNAARTVDWYKKRFWIEEMFRDFKVAWACARPISRMRNDWLVFCWGTRLPISFSLWSP